MIIVIASFVTAGLTFFSGFGLGTILMPVFAVFFPVEIAIALTGVVHFTTNLFKLTIVGRKAVKPVLLKFGIPAILASLAGAWLLIRLTTLPRVFGYHLGNTGFDVTPIKLVVAILLLLFSLVEIIPRTRNVRFAHNQLVWGGILSGFFGGLSGFQGAIRSAFLIKSGLAKEAYIATGVVIACLVDFTRISVYASRFRNADLKDHLSLILAAVMAAIAGAALANKLLPKITYRFVRVLVFLMLFMLAMLMGAGII